jgi:hypothetical protein
MNVNNDKELKESELNEVIEMAIIIVELEENK